MTSTYAVGPTTACLCSISACTDSEIERTTARTHARSRSALHRATPHRASKEGSRRRSFAHCRRTRPRAIRAFLPAFPHKRPLIRACGARREANQPPQPPKYARTCTRTQVPYKRVCQRHAEPPRRRPRSISSTDAPSPPRRLPRSVSSPAAPRSFVRPSVSLITFHLPRRPSPSSVAAHRLHPPDTMPTNLFNAQPAHPRPNKLQRPRPRTRTRVVHGDGTMA